MIYDVASIKKQYYCKYIKIVVDDMSTTAASVRSVNYWAGVLG